MLWKHGTSAPFGSWSYGYNNRGKRLSSTDITGRAATYGYDDASRLTSETITSDPHGANFNGALSYGLDGAGNRLTRTSTLAALAAQTFSCDANDQLSTDSYDANGNTLTSEGHSFAYDFENRLVSKDSGAVTLQYDCDGNRVAKTVGGVTTRYLADDLNPTGYVQDLEEVVSGQVQTRYTFGTAIVSQTRGVSTTASTSYFGFDGHGNVTFLTDAGGAVTASYDYDAWGNVVASTGSTPNSRLYAGEELDPDLGLVNLRARQYKSETGRFLKLDPLDVVSNGAARESMLSNAIAHVAQPHLRSVLEIALPDRSVLGERAFAPLGLNRYLYANGDPVTLVDPTGATPALEYAVLASEAWLWAHGTYVFLTGNQQIKKTEACLLPGGLAALSGTKLLLNTPGLSIVGALLDIACSIGGWVNE